MSAKAPCRSFELRHATPGGRPGSAGAGAEEGVRDDEVFHTGGGGARVFHGLLLLVDEGTAIFIIPAHFILSSSVIS